MNILEDLDNIRIQIGGAILEMKYIFDEGKLKRVTTRSHGDHFVKRIQTFCGMDCRDENITEEKEETNMSTENLETFKRNFTSHFGGPGDYIHSSIQGLIGSDDNNRQPSYDAESEESGEFEDSWEGDHVQLSIQGLVGSNENINRHHAQPSYVVESDDSEEFGVSDDSLESDESLLFEESTDSKKFKESSMPDGLDAFPKIFHNCPISRVI